MGEKILKELEGIVEEIIYTNEENGYINYQYKGYRYYKENPSLLVFEPIKVILKDCGLYQGG